jgi:hypothetical protein
MPEEVFRAADLHRLMFGLLYPAVLGTFFFALLPALIGFRKREVESLPRLKTITGSLVVLHFIVDFHLTSSLPAETYNPGGFIVDLLIICFLFRAFDALNVSRVTQPIRVSDAATALALTYFLFLAWSLLTLGVEPANLLLWSAEVAGLVIFLIVRATGNVTFLCCTLVLMSGIMAFLGSLAVASI